MLKHFCPHMAAWHSNNNPMRLLHHLAGTNPTNQPGKPSTQVQVQDWSRLELKQSPTMPSTDLNTGCDQSQGQTTHPIKSRNTTNTLERNREKQHQNIEDQLGLFVVKVFGCNAPQKVGKTDASEEICENAPCELLSQVAFVIFCFLKKSLEKF